MKIKIGNSINVSFDIRLGFGISVFSSFLAASLTPWCVLDNRHHLPLVS